MKYFDWNEEKDQQLQIERNISFAEITLAITEGKVLDITPNPNAQQYPRQRIFVVEVRHYAYLVPFVEDETKIFLKTIIPSRKATKKYILQKKTT